MFKERQSCFLFEDDAPYVEEKYELYLADPNAVTADWRAWFDALRDTPAIDGSNRDDEPHALAVLSFVELAKRTPIWPTATMAPTCCRWKSTATRR